MTPRDYQVVYDRYRTASGDVSRRRRELEQADPELLEALTRETQLRCELKQLEGLTPGLAWKEILGDFNRRKPRQ